MGVTGLETAFAALYTGPRAARACSTLDAAGRADDRGRRAASACRCPRIARGAPANLCLVDLDAEWEVGEAGYESRSRQLAASPGASCTGRVLMTVAAGAVAYRERGFAIRLADGRLAAPGRA